MQVKEFLDAKEVSMNSKGVVSIPMEKMKGLMKEFAELNCAEQRIICADMLTDPDMIRYVPVMNARPPLI